MLDLIFYYNGEEIETWEDYPVVPRIGESVYLNYDNSYHVTFNVVSVTYTKHNSVYIDVTQ